MKSKPITPAQLKIIHTLLTKQGLTADKVNLVYGFSNGRTESSKELTLLEAKDFIQYLKDKDAGSALIKRIWHLGYVSGIIYGDSSEDKAINAAKLNLFVQQRGTVKKPLHSQSFTELKKTVKQFEAIVSKTDEKKYLAEYFKLVEQGIQNAVEEEDYEAAAHNRDCIEIARKNPALAVKYMKQLEKENNPA
jgi:hypothetical protein